MKRGSDRGMAVRRQRTGLDHAASVVTPAAHNGPAGVQEEAVEEGSRRRHERHVQCGHPTAACCQVAPDPPEGCEHQRVQGGKLCCRQVPGYTGVDQAFPRRQGLSDQQVDAVVMPDPRREGSPRRRDGDGEQQRQHEGHAGPVGHAATVYWRCLRLGSMHGLFVGWRERGSRSPNGRE